MLILSAALLLLAQHDPLGFVMPMFDTQARFHEEVARSRWLANQFDYVDGASSAVLRHPYTIAHAPDGTLFVASFTLNHVVRLRWLDGKRASYKIFVKDRELDGPVGMALDDEDALYVASFTNDVVLRVNSTDGTLLSRIGDEETLDCPEGLALGPDGNLYVTSFLLPYLSVFEPKTGKFVGRFGELTSQQSAGVGAPVPRRPITLAGAEDVTFDLNGDVHATAYYSSAIFKFNGTSGELAYTYGKSFVKGPVGITCDVASGDIFVASYKDNRVLRFTSGGDFLGVAAGGGTTGEDDGAEAARRRRLGKAATINSPSGLAFAEDGTLWVASYTTGAVTRFNSTYGGGGSRTFWRVTD